MSRLPQFYYLYVVLGELHFFRRDYTYNGDFASFYKVHTVSRSWADAKQRCHRESASLFFPDTQAEAQYATELISSKVNNFNYVWIGISDIISEGDFETITGKQIEETYADWENGEPNNVNDNEDCVIFTKAGKMNDKDCKEKIPFICKKNLASVEWNALCDMADPSYMYNGDLGKCYKFHLRPMNWTSAHAICLAEQSYLAVINSQKEADYLVKMTKEAPKDRFKGHYLSGAVHLGFHNQLGEGYTTVYGTPLEESGYTHWGGGQPDGRDHEFCGSMFFNGGLNDMFCGSICFFICEHDIGAFNSSFDERFGEANN